MTRLPIAAALLILALPARAESPPARAIAVVIDSTTAGRPAFDPAAALGAGVDGAGVGDADRLLTPHNIAAMRSAGLARLTYRLRTELGIEAWHWNPAGHWSDPARSQGYWTGDTTPRAPIALSWGYKLPRRGDTTDNANDTDFSRLTDGDEASFWKSNPYLDPAFLKDGMAHPQWLVVRLDQPAPVDTVRIAWGTPYAVRYAVQYWTGANEYSRGAQWVTFAHGAVAAGTGGEALMRVADAPVSTRFVRVLLEQGSGTAPAGSSDWRDGAGFAVREIGVGTTDGAGHFADLLRHGAAADRQSFTHVSSTDPWHREADRDPTLEQPGIDRVLASPLANGAPVMVPTGLLYDTPDNAAAELIYLKRRGYKVRQVELGEEPDGQYGAAEDFGALYLAFAARLRRVWPGVVIGGPSAQDAFTGTWMNSDPDRSWNSHFIRYLKARGQLGALGFYSFEHYPFDEICGDIPALLVGQDRQMDALFARLRAEGVPTTIPWIITEYGFSAYSGRAMSEMPSALLMANIVGQFFTRGGAAAYLYGYGPNWPVNQHLDCAGYGNMMLHMADPHGQATTPMPEYWTARLLTRDWLMPRGRHVALAAEVTGADDRRQQAWAVRRPDRRTAVLLLNRDPAQAATVDLSTRDARGAAHAITGPARVYAYGPAQYAWIDDGPNSRPLRSDPPAQTRLGAGAVRVTLPPMSLAVVVPEGH